MFRAVFEFRLTRRVDWAGDIATFHEHVDAVRSLIAASKRTDDVRVVADMSASRLTLDFLIDSDTEEAAEQDAMYTVSRAIRASGARYLGLAAMAQDPASSNSTLSDLHTPIWQRQRLQIAGAA